MLRGEARFLDPNTLSVAGKTLTARRFVIAAGSRPAVPKIEGLDQIRYWTNEFLFDLEERPDHLMILGGGPVGLEMADAFHGLGCRVTLVEGHRIAAKEDPELAEGLRIALTARGVAILEGSAVTRVEAGPTLILADGRRISGSHLLVATGRTADLQALQLAAGNIQAGRDGDSDRSRTSQYNQPACLRGG